MYDYDHVIDPSDHDDYQEKVFAGLQRKGPDGKYQGIFAQPEEKQEEPDLNMRRFLAAVAHATSIPLSENTTDSNELAVSTDGSKEDHWEYLEKNGLKEPRIFKAKPATDPLPPASLQPLDGSLSDLTAKEVTDPETHVLKQLDMFANNTTEP